MRTTAETEWITQLAHSSGAARDRALKTFALQYHWFSLHQVIAFAGIFGSVDPRDREALCELAAVLHEELGEGRLPRVHSVLFEDFAETVGLSRARLPLDEGEVLPEVKEYVERLHLGFRSDPRSAALTYRFLEASAVESYGMLLAAFTDAGIDRSGLEFFSLHSGLEPEHLEGAQRLVMRVDPEAAPWPKTEVEKDLADAWQAMWRALTRTCFHST